MTEDEAKAKWCPFVRVAVEFNQYVGSANRGLAKDEEPHSTCIAPACMAWRWVAEFASRAEAAYRRDGARLRPEQGFCGLAGRPE